MSRQSRSLQQILDTLSRHQQPMSAQEIFVALRGQQQSLGLATIYRGIETLCNEGKLQQIHLGDNQAYYYLLPHDGHNRHYLICTECRSVIALSSCPVEDLENRLSKQYNFVIERHVLDFYGVCARCRGHE
ncbi:MAG: transcriptional repressor [Thermostichales cyanobacterium BF4_bins_65]